MSHSVEVSQRPTSITLMHTFLIPGVHPAKLEHHEQRNDITQPSPANQFAALLFLYHDKFTCIFDVELPSDKYT